MITVRGDGQKGMTFLLKLYFLHACVCCADEGLHQGVERAAFKQRGGTVERTEVSVDLNTSHM